MVNIRKEDKELISSARKLRNIRGKIEQLNDNLNDLSKRKDDIEKQIQEKEKEIEKTIRIKRISKNVTIAGSGLSFISSAISGGLSLSDYSQEGGILSFAGSATSGLFALAGSIVDNHFSSKESELQDVKVKLKEERKPRLEEKISRDRRSLRESWNELLDIYEDLHLFMYTTEFSEEVDKIISNFLGVLEELSKKSEKGEAEKKGSEKEETDFTFKRISLVAVSPPTVSSPTRSPPTRSPPGTFDSITIRNVLVCDKRKRQILRDEELPQKWQECNIAQAIEKLVEKVDNYRQEIIKEIAKKKEAGFRLLTENNELLQN